MSLGHCSIRGSASAAWSRRGFTLVEMLMVILVIVVLIALAARPLMLGRAVSVTTAGNEVMENMAYARELAIANNQPVEVWFLRATGGTLLTGLQIYLVDQSGSSSSFGGVYHMPPPIGMDSGSALSPLFVAGNKKSFGSGNPQPLIPGYGTSYDAWYVRFMPDGSTTLSSTQQWYLTVHDVALGDQLSLSSGQIPNINYAVIALDPVAGNVSLYRP